MTKERHVFEALGRARIVVEDCEVVEVSEPLIRYCRLWEKMRGITQFTEEQIRENITFRIQDFGLCTKDRVIELDTFVGFGASETFMTALRRHLLDSTVTVCEGAGTVITSNPSLVQGIGARLSGVIETCQVKAIIQKIEAHGGMVLDPPRIDQVAGLQSALDAGHMSIGVTVADLATAQRCRALSTSALLFGVHLTGIARDAAEALFEYVDLVTACASMHIRELAQGRALVQAGTAIPIFALTARGKEILLERAKEIDAPLLVNTMRLPVLPEEKQPRPLI